MSKLIEITKESFNSDNKKRLLCQELEEGNILLFSNEMIGFDKDIFSSLRDIKNDKNLTAESLKKYSQNVLNFLSKLLTCYTNDISLSYTRFLPSQETKKAKIDNLLNIDIFNKKELLGNRVLCFCSNIDTKNTINYVTSENFESIVKKYTQSNDLTVPSIRTTSIYKKVENKMKKAIKSIGISVNINSPYDNFMMKLQHFLKNNEKFQKEAKKNKCEFLPNTSWVFFSDAIAHSTIEGQNLLQQSLVVSKNALVNPEKSPLSVLERHTKEALVEPENILLQ